LPATMWLRYVYGHLESLRLRYKKPNLPGLVFINCLKEKPLPLEEKKNFNRNSFVTTSVADLVCLSRIQKFSIPDPIFFSSQIPDPESCIHIMKCILNKQKLFLSSRKHDPGCSSLIRIMDPDPDFYTSQSRIQRHWIPDPQHWIIIRIRDKHSRIPNTSNKETINNNPWVLKLSELRA